MYDWANSAFATTVVAAVFPIYYSTVIGTCLPGNLASVYFGYTTAVGLTLVALVSPVLGAIADRNQAKKKMLGGFVALLVFFVGGALLLSQVDVDRGQTVARNTTPSRLI